MYNVYSFVSDVFTVEFNQQVIHLDSPRTMCSKCGWAGLQREVSNMGTRAQKVFLLPNIAGHQFR